MREAMNRDIIDALGKRLRSEVEALVPDGPVALIGFPAYPNVGDSAIWCGHKVLLRDMGLRVAYVADVISFDPRALRRAMPVGTVLLVGGGNLGDLWQGHQALRVRVIENLPDYRIVQLPQTSRFLAQSAKEQAKALFLSHGDFHILCRDRATLREMIDINGGRASMAPDGAFVLGSIGRTHRGAGNLWLARRDDEAESALEARNSVDWIDARAGATRDPFYTASLRLLVAFEAKVQVRAHRVGFDAIPNKLSIRAFDWLARRRLGAGLTLLAGASILVTDRLHAHILAMLLDVPHVLVDTGYGKIRGFHEAWTPGARGVKFTTDPSRVPALVAELEDLEVDRRSSCDAMRGVD